MPGRVPNPGGARRAHLRELRHESLWFWPAIAAIAAWVGGDLRGPGPAAASRSIRGCSRPNLDDARTLLATIATALLTFTGVVFSITLVALQMASSQYSPRVLRTFVRKPVTKLALSTFIATFVYSLTLLARVGTCGVAHTVPQGAVGLAYLLVMVSIIVFVFFVHSTVRSMRVTYVIEAVFRETLGSATNTFAEAASYVDAEPPADLAGRRNESDSTTPTPCSTASTPTAWSSSPRRTGACCASPCPSARSSPGASSSSTCSARRHPARPAEILRCDAQLGRPHHLPGPQLRRAPAGRHRHPRPLPAINDPTTAVQSLDRLHGVLRAVANRPDPRAYYVDAQGTVRLIVPVPGWDRLVELAFTEVALYGSGSPQVTRKLTAIFDDLAACVPPERVGPIEAQRAWLRGEVGRRHTLPTDRVLTPDPLGLG